MKVKRLTSPKLLDKIKYADSLYQQKRFEEAIEELLPLVKMVDNSYAYNKCEIYRKLGNNYYALNDWDNAIWAYEQTLRFYTNNASVFNMLGYMLFYKDNDKSIYYYLKGMELAAELKNFVMLTQVMIKSKNYSQKDLKTIFERYVNCFRNNFLGHNLPFSYNNKTFDRNKKLRIGYLSSDFHCHAMMSFVLPILENHDRDKFDIFLYSCGQKSDYATERIKNTGTFCDCKGLDEYEVAKRIYEDKIDILVDLSGYTHKYIWSLLYKPAPIICQYLGFLGTYGMREVDYIIVDKFTIPEETAPYYTEKPMYIDCGMNRFTFNTVNQKLPDIAPLPYLENGYITFGSFNSPLKLNNFTLDLWSKVLKAVPNSKLLIYRTQLQERDIVRLKKRFENNEIDENRIIFESKSMPISHFQSYPLCDITLDPSPFSGLTITIEEAFMGVPVITLVGETISAKGGARVNLAMGQDNLVAYSEDEYVEKAAALANDIEKVKYYRQNLRDIISKSPLFTDYKAYVEEIENQYTKAWQEYCDK